VDARRINKSFQTGGIFSLNYRGVLDILLLFGDDAVGDEHCLKLGALHGLLFYQARGYCIKQLAVRFDYLLGLP